MNGPPDQEDERQATLILVVEDSHSDAALVEAMLAIGAAPGEFAVEWRETLAGARELIRSEPFDCALLDLSLPDSSGIEGLVALAAEFPGLAIVVLTGNDDPALALQVVKAGAQDYLLKGEVSGGSIARAVRHAIERKQSAEALRRAEERFRSAFEGAPIGIGVLEVDGSFVEANPALCSITGRGAEELVSSSLVAILHADDQAAVSTGIESLVSGEAGNVNGEWRIQHALGGARWVALSMATLSGAKQRLIVQAQDLTERKRLEDGLRFMSEHDPLSGLLNRGAFEYELEKEVERGARHGPRGAVIVVDLDHFKDINDSFGNATGDELLVQAATVLGRRLRRSDKLARLGGDQFGVLLPDADAREAQSVAAEMLSQIRRVAIAAGEHSLHVTASIGIARFADSPKSTGEEMLVNADLAMYEAKTGGRNRVGVHAPERQRGGGDKSRVVWADRIRQALAGDGFELFAQPIVDLKSGSTDRYELLLRMRNDSGDAIPPAAFLDVAERVGLIGEIDRWVVRKAIAMAGRLTGPDAVILEVNLSGATISDAGLLELIEERLYSEKVEASRIVFEVTETAAVTNMHDARTFARDLRQLGCGFALDDFGSGFGSFYYLKHLPFDYLKIDGEFVRNCLNDPTDRLVIECLVKIVGELGRSTIAEFVEDEATQSFLAKAGIDYAQGFHIGRPRPTIEVFGETVVKPPGEVAAPRSRVK